MEDGFCQIQSQIVSVILPTYAYTCDGRKSLRILYIVRQVLPLII